MTRRAVASKEPFRSVQYSAASGRTYTPCIYGTNAHTHVAFFSISLRILSSLVVDSSTTTSNAWLHPVCLWWRRRRRPEAMEGGAGRETTRRRGLSGGNADQCGTLYMEKKIVFIISRDVGKFTIAMLRSEEATQKLSYHF
ncbi:hypothetical protein DAI22_03g098800 [Oryza sativa Japonica Group]|nr:hypothetical protein DAI22_03g098800 [Oryza sativa Japonica Group]